MGLAKHKRAKLERHPVGVVHSVSGRGPSVDHGWVRCERRGGSIPVSVCEKCPDCAEITSDEEGAIDSVMCNARAPADAERANSREPLRLSRSTVGDLMTRNVLCVRPDLSLDAVTELFVESGLKAAPVVDDQGNLLGLVSESEVLIDVYANASASRAPHGPPSDDDVLNIGTTRTVADVMLPCAFTLPEHTSITRAAAVMAFEGASRVTVVSTDGRVVGVLSAGDILYWLAKSDGYALPPLPSRMQR